MTLKEVINRVSWAKIEEKMFAIYPEETDSLHYYKRLYWTLINLDADENPTGKMIEFELLSEDEELYYEMEADDYDDYDDVYEDGFQMDAACWNRLLGYFISYGLLEEMDEAEIIAHTFVEATYGGFREA